ncbi:Permease of the drug/metabolite transporter (DMT) superfamily [Fervidobacterium changbaicum]|uniref:EamA/RhaT family transporter n=1 Tax=Fervidobacterium changbaicum TaxID=310769 RepID=A0ABX5QR80_9BACT|nr:DMT family transporter [Fervidobacterium changbaicum]QAV32987.1 EamA/RhaT family transporter [Fervidobacterium changbaicum]SDH61355.1 Permease of the drug/metabolite transporter (DMT) superfamily [Fervidobacterium changbaicum]
MRNGVVKEYTLKDKFIAVFWLLTLTFLWGLTFPIQKLVLNKEVSPFLYNAIRFWIATFLSALLFRKSDWKRGSILGLVMAIAYATQTWGLTITTSTKSGFITSLYIVIVPFFSYLVEHEKVRKLQVVGFTGALIGMYMLSGGISGYNFGDFLTTICGVMYALHVVLITKYSKQVSEYALLTPQFFTVALLNTIFNLFYQSGSDKWSFSLNALFVATFTAVTATIVAIIIQAKYQKVVGSNISALIFVGEPLFAMILSVLILKEHLTALQLIGGLLMVVSIILGVLNLSEREPEMMERQG